MSHIRTALTAAPGETVDHVEAVQTPSRRPRRTFAAALLAAPIVGVLCTASWASTAAVGEASASGADLVPSGCPVVVAQDIVGEDIASSVVASGRADAGHDTLGTASATAGAAGTVQVRGVTARAGVATAQACQVLDRAASTGAAGSVVVENGVRAGARLGTQVVPVATATAGSPAAAVRARVRVGGGATEPVLRQPDDGPVHHCGGRAPVAGTTAPPVAAPATVGVGARARVGVAALPAPIRTDGTTATAGTASRATLTATARARAETVGRARAGVAADGARVVAGLQDAAGNALGTATSARVEAGARAVAR